MRTCVSARVCQCARVFYAHMYVGSRWKRDGHCKCNFLCYSVFARTVERLRARERVYACIIMVLSI